MPIISKIIKILLKQSCLLCRQNSDEIVCNFCFANLFSNLHYKKKTIYLDQEYDYYYLFKYSMEAKYLLKRFKFHKDLLVVPVFEKLFKLWWDDFAKEHLSDASMIAAVPMHRFRYLYRGFNQNEILTQKISNYTKIAVNLCYKRIKYTKPQAKLSRQDRIDKIGGVFKIMQPIEAKHLIIFDDVLTTGSTLKEFIKTIKAESQIEKISVVTLVRPN